MRYGPIRETEIEYHQTITQDLAFQRVEVPFAQAWEKENVIACIM